MRIKFIIPRPTDAQGLAVMAEPQIPRDLVGADVDFESVAVRLCGDDLVSHYETLLMDFYVAEAGLRAEEEGFDAVVVDTVTDSGLDALRSRLTIPVVGPGIVAYGISIMLGHRFSILTMWDRWRFFYEKNLTGYGLREKCASIRSIDVTPDLDNLLSGKEDEVFPLLEAAARRCIDEDGADVIVLGSTTMHQAADYLTERLPVPVINPGRVALTLAVMFVKLGLSHSKTGYPSSISLQDWKYWPSSDRQDGSPPDGGGAQHAAR